MKKINKSISLLSIMILVIGMCGGCMNKETNKDQKDSKEAEDQVSKDKESNDPEVIKDKIISFLNNKYGKEFLPMSLNLKEFPNYQDGLTVYPKGGDKKKDSFYAIGKMKDGEYTVSDDYVCLLVKDEYEIRVRKIAEEFLPQCKVEISFVDIFFPNEFASNTKFQDIIDAGVKYDPTVYVEVAPTLGSVDEFNKNVDLFAKKMAESKLQGSPLVYYLKENNLNLDFKDMNPETYQKRREITIKQDFSIKNYD